MKRINIFISSSERELENEREIASEVVHSLNLQPVLFELYPALSNSPFEAFIEQVHNCDIFVLILWKSFRPAVKMEYESAIEKNKPILIFIKTCEYEEKRDEELEEFMGQFICDNNIPKVKISSWRNFRGLKSLRENLHQSLTNEISKFYKEPSSTLTREEMYDLGSNIITHAQKRLYIYQRTPTLFLGTKDRNKPNQYESKSHQPYEMRFLNALEKWINDHWQINDVEFLYLYDANLSKTELKKNISKESKEKKIIEVKAKLKKYKEIEEQSNYRFRFSPLETPVSGPLIIGDNRYAIWVLGSEDAISFSQEDAKMSSILIRMIKSQLNKASLDFQDFLNF